MIVIEKKRGFGALGLHEIWEFRDLLFIHVAKTVRAKYRQMAFGPLWIIFQPVINMVLFTFIFNGLAGFSSGEIPYPIFTFVALLPWQFFSSVAVSSLGSLNGQMGIISKVYFPRLILPLSDALGSLVDFLASSLVLVALMVFYRVPLSSGVLVLPLYLLLAAASGLAIGLWFSAIAVRFRDLSIVVGTLLRVAVYLTPVAYSVDTIVERAPGLLWLYKLNPMFWVVEGFRKALLNTGVEPSVEMIVPVLLVCVMFVTGLFIFRRAERSIVDLL